MINKSVILKTLFIWPLAGNVTYNMQGLPPLISELGFVITSMLTNKKTCEVSVHFNKIPHNLGDFSFQCIDQVQAHNNSEEIERLLITKEAYWSAQLFSLAPHGLNKRREFHSKNRICYNQVSLLQLAFLRGSFYRGPFLVSTALHCLFSYCVRRSFSFWFLVSFVVFC